MNTDTSSLATDTPAQAPQSLALDARATAMLKAMGVSWRWPAPVEMIPAAVALPATETVTSEAQARDDHRQQAGSYNADAASQTPVGVGPASDAPHTSEAVAHQPLAHGGDRQQAGSYNADAASQAAVGAGPASDAPHTPQPHPTPVTLDGLNWDGLQHAAASCQACGLSAGRVGHSWGQGSERARWLFITPRLHPSDDGDATVQGDEQTLLISLWRAMGVLEGDVFVTSLTKCRAALGLNASAEDTAQCLRYLHHQVQWLQPDMIVALGLPVAHALWGSSDAPLAQWRGQIHQWQNTPAVVTYPLDALLRRPVDKAKWWADMCLALDHLTSNEPT